MLRAEELAAIAALAGLAICAYAAAGGPASRAPAGTAAGPVPAILDTDIGDDIDDPWALSLLLKSPAVDLKLVVGDNGSALYRARLIAKMLQAAGRAGPGEGPGPAEGSDPSLPSFPAFFPRSLSPQRPATAFASAAAPGPPRRGPTGPSWPARVSAR